MTEAHLPRFAQSNRDSYLHCPRSMQCNGSNCAAALFTAVRLAIGEDQAPTSVYHATFGSPWTDFAVRLRRCAACPESGYSRRHTGSPGCETTTPAMFASPCPSWALRAAVRALGALINFSHLLFGGAMLQPSLGVHYPTLFSASRFIPLRSGSIETGTTKRTSSA